MVRTAPSNQKHGKKLGKLVQDVQSHKSPGTPKLLIIRSTDKSEYIFTKDQQNYPLDIGLLLYPVKHLHPNFANVTRKLSKAINNANSVAYKELLCVVSYVLDTKTLGLKIKPTRNSNNS